MEDCKNTSGLHKAVHDAVDSLKAAGARAVCVQAHDAAKRGVYMHGNRELAIHCGLAVIKDVLEDILNYMRTSEQGEAAEVLEDRTMQLLAEFQSVIDELLSTWNTISTVAKIESMLKGTN